MTRIITNKTKHEITGRLKALLFFAATFFAAGVTNAQYWTIAYCSSAPASNLGSSVYGPMYSTATANATNRIAVIYPSSQLAGIAGQTLTSAYFFRKTTTGSMAGTPNFKIYLKEVSAADWGSGSLNWATATTGATLVYNSNPASIVGSAAGWKSFPFSTNFTYSGTQNLAVFMEYTNPTASTAIEWAYEYTSSCVNTSNSNTTKYSNVTTGTLPASLSTSNYRRPYIGFDYVVPPCNGTPVAGTLDVTTQSLCTGATPATISAIGYTAGASGLVYEWQESDDDGIGDPWAPVTGGNGASTPSFAPPVFSGNTIYYRLVVTCTNGGGFDVSASSVLNAIGTPATAATAITFSNITNTSMTVGWTNGTGNRRYVVVNTVNSFTDPVDGTTGPTVAGTTYSGAGEQIVYDGTGSSVTVNGLTCNTTYYVRVYEYQRCGSAAPYNYFFNVNTSAANPASQAVAAPAAASLPASNNFNGFTGANLGTVAPGWYEGKITTTGGSTPAHNNPLTTGSTWTYSTDLGVTTARINLYTNTRNEWIISPLINLTSSSRLRFKAAITENASGAVDAAGMQGTDDSVLVMVSTDGCGINWTPVYAFHAANTTGLTNVLTDYFISLGAYTNQTIQIAFQATDGPVDNTPDYDFHITNLVVEAVPTCDIPTNITLGSVTPSGATVSWTASVSTPTNGYDYYVHTSSTAPAANATPTGNVQGTSATATGLPPSTLHYLWVRSNCGSSIGSWEGPVSFTTRPGNDDCANATTLTVNTGSACTAVTSGTTFAASQSSETAPSCGPTGVNDDVWFKFTATSMAHKIALSNVSGSTDMAMALYSGNCGSLTQLTCSDPNTFDALGLSIGTTYYVRVWTFTATATTSATFDVCVSTIACPYPTNATATNLTPSSVSLGWTENGSAALWEVEYGPGAFTLGTGTRTTVSTNPYTLGNLTSGTAYSYFVRAICGAGDTSSWTSRVNFTTDCNPFTLPYTQDFASYVPSCWSEQTGALTASSVLSGTTSGWASDDWMNTTANGKAAKVNVFAASKRDWLISPTIDLGAGGNNQLKFDILFAAFGSATLNEALGTDDTVAVVISTNNGATWSLANALMIWNASNSNTLMQPVTISLAGYSGQVKIGFYASEGVVNDANDVDVMIDNFLVQTTPLAIKLNGIQAVNAGLRNRVEWITVSELRGDYFELERSADGSNFSKLVTIDAKGAASSYTYWDEQPLQGTNYYRLNMRDASGAGNYSKVVTAQVKEQGVFGIQAYPNPVKGMLTVKLGGVAGANASITVTDVAGKAVATAAVTGDRTQIDMQALPDGIYILKYKDDLRSETLKINKQ